VDILVVDIPEVDIPEEDIPVKDILVEELVVAALFERHKTDSYLAEVDVDILLSEDLRNFVAQNLRCLEQNLR